jgi:HEAT repeat protein
MTDSTDVPAPGPSRDDRAPGAAERDPARRGAAWRRLGLPALAALGLVAAWWLIGRWWLAPAEPEELLRRLQEPHRQRWVPAAQLAQQLGRPERQALRRDATFANRLTRLLEAEIEAGGLTEDALRLRSYLCRAVGECEGPDVLPILIRAAGTQRARQELAVQQAALEAIAIRIGRGGDQRLRTDPALIAGLLAASRVRAVEWPDDAREAAVRGAAAFALGVLGGETAVTRLEELLSDPQPDVRFNAATGLARQGSLAALGVLGEMLDPQRLESALTGTGPERLEAQRQQVRSNALRAVGRLAQTRTATELSPLIAALERLAADSGDAVAAGAARQTLQAIQSVPAADRDGRND